MQSALPDIFAVFALVFYVIVLGVVVWALYLAYLATRALRKYLRS